MGLLLFLCLAPPCLLVIWRRRRSGVPFAVPLVGVAALLIFATWSALVVRRFPELAGLSDPSRKAVLLGWCVSVLMNWGAFLIVVVLPVTLAGYFVDRWLINRWKRRR